MAHFTPSWDPPWDPDGAAAAVRRRRLGFSAVRTVEVPQTEFLTVGGARPIGQGGVKWKMGKEKRERVVTIAGCRTDDSMDYSKVKHSLATWC